MVAIVPPPSSATSSAAAITAAANDLKSSIESGNLASALRHWTAFKPLVVTAIAFCPKTEFSTIATIRDALELACLLHVRNEDVREFDRCILLLEPIYVDYPEPLLPPSLKKPTVISLQLLRLLTSSRIGDLYVDLQTLSPLEKSTPELRFVIDLEQCLMSGNYEKCVANISCPPNPHLQFFCSQLKESIRHRVASCLQKSHTEISVARVKQLLMLESDQQLLSFVEEQNRIAGLMGRLPSTERDGIAAVAEDDEPMDGGEEDHYRSSSRSRTAAANILNILGASSASTDPEGDGCEVPLIQWNVTGDRIQFVTVDERKPQIPVNEVISCMIGYAVELERIV